jgi:TolB protein
LRGTIAYPAFEGETYNIYFGDVASSQSQLRRQGASQPAFNADGSRIAFLSWEGGAGRGLVTAPTSGGPELLISGAPEDKLPTWSPDSSTILFFTRRRGDRASLLYRTQANTLFQGTEAQQLLIEGEYPSWSASGQIAFRGWGLSGVGLRFGPAALDNPIALTDRGEDTAPALAPDGQKIVFMSRRDDNWEIYSINADGSGLQRLTEDPAEDGLPTWSPDGRAIAYVSRADGEWAIWAMTPNGRERRKLLSMRNSPHGTVFNDQNNSFGWTEERISWAP